MAKQDWGTKRLCQSCTTKFYDFGRTPILCPKCETKFDPETLLKSRRGRTSAAKQAAKQAAKPAPVPKPAKDKDKAGDDLDEEALKADETDKDNDEDDGDDSVLVDDSDMSEDDVKQAVGAGEKGGGDEN